jgi:alpha-L-fucosidase
MKQQTQLFVRLTMALLIVGLIHPQLALSSSRKVKPPEPFGPVPSPRQLQWHDLEFYGFLHFTINTFTDREWGYGDEDPAQRY